MYKKCGRCICLEGLTWREEYGLFLQLCQSFQLLPSKSLGRCKEGRNNPGLIPVGNVSGYFIRGQSTNIWILPAKYPIVPVKYSDLDLTG